MATWPARTAGLEVEAEPQIVETLLTLLEKVADRQRRPIVEEESNYSRAVLASKPKAYWRLSEIQGRTAYDAIGKQHGTYEDGVALYLPGVGYTSEPPVGFPNRAAHFAGGRVKAKVGAIGEEYTLEFCFWNGLPSDARHETGYLCGWNNSQGKGFGYYLRINGNSNADDQGKLFWSEAFSKWKTGQARLADKTWYHIALVRRPDYLRIYLNGQPELDLMGRSKPIKDAELYLGGAAGYGSNFEGKLDEAALYDRVLSPDEVAAHYRALSE